MEEVAQNIILKKGVELTIDGEIISIGGQIIFKDCQKVKVKEVLKEPGKWSKAGYGWIDERIVGVKLVRHYGIWFLDTFKETKVKK